ncbi:hypothetical protein AGMMS49525_10040 [Bacteroidia bacterium]|nr:hypothetical protein AGMMS49525_10040 [Bacteroidia bacterium]
MKVLFFATLLLAGAFAIDFMLEKGLKKTGTGEFSTWNAIFSSNINADAIILGSSRALVQIDPEILDTTLHVNAYNLGMDGYPFSMQYVRYKIFEKYNKKPKLIIQNVDFMTLFRGTPINKVQFAPYMHEDVLKKELEAMGISETERHVPASSYYSEYATIVKGVSEFFNLKHFPSERYKGYFGQDKTWDGVDFQKRLAQDSIVAEKNPEIVNLFDSFLKECEASGVQMVLVFSPQYIKMTEFTKNRDTEMQLYRSFAEKYNIQFLDYSDDPLCYDTTYFYNAMHLNKKGAELFSLKLAKDIEIQQ